jgi:hypothetical protein
VAIPSADLIAASDRKVRRVFAWQWLDDALRTTSEAAILRSQGALRLAEMVQRRAGAFLRGGAPAKG